MTILAKILEKSENLFIRYGTRSVTMDDIAQELGVSKKTLYQNVASKTDLISRIMLSHFERQKREICDISTQSEDAIDEMFRLTKYAVQQLHKLSPKLLYDLQKYDRLIWLSLQKNYLAHGQKTIGENIKRGQKQGVYRADINIDIMTKFYMKNIFLLVDEDIFPLNDFDKESLFIEYIKYHIHGIASKKGIRDLKINKACNKNQ